MAFASINQASVGGGSSNALSIQSDGIFMPRLSTGQRTALALTTSDAGLTVYDFTLNNLFIWNGAAWESIPGSGDAGANGSVQYNDNGIVSGATNFVWDKVNGRVGIGTATPANQLSVRNEGASGISVIDVRGGTGGAGALQISGNGTTLGTTSFNFIQNGAGAFINNQDATPLAFSVNGAERARFNTTGAFVLAGGTTTANGVGVAFPAVQVPSSDANCLDDYEEGTFTPTIVGTTIAGVGVYGDQNGRYTKVGRLVTCQIFVNWTAHTGTGDMRIGGLPFATTSTAGIYQAASIGWVNNIALTAGYVMTAYALDNSSTLITLQQYPTGGGTVTSVPIDTLGGIIISVSYIV